MKLLHTHTLQAKFLAGLTIAGLVVGCVFAAGFYVHLRQMLEQEVEDKAELVFFQVDAVQKYVRQTLRPAMFSELRGKFVIEAMSSSFVTRAVMDQTREADGQRIYRRVALNARNPAYEAVGLERELIDHFRAHPGETRWQGYRDIGAGEHFFMARPVRYDRGCLRCHGEPADAPAEVLEKYGDRGFGHPENSIGGVVLVGLPVSSSVAWIKSKSVIYLCIFSISVLLFVGASQLVFRRVVATNLRAVAGLFRAQLDGEEDGLAREIERCDELTALTTGVERLGEMLQDSRQRLKDYAANLETMVQERTAELAEEANGRQADVQLFVDLLAEFSHSQTRPQIWRGALPCLVHRFGLQRAAYICTYASKRAYVWPEDQPSPELPEDWIELLTSGSDRIDGRRAWITVSSSQAATEGLLLLEHAPGESFRDQDREVLRAIGRQLAIAAEHLSALDDILRHHANLQAIFEGISDPLLLLDVTGEAVVTNQAARDLAAALSGGARRDGNVIPFLCENDGDDCEIARVAAEGRFSSREVELGGRSFALSLYPVRGGDRDTGRVIVYVRERTDEKRMLEQFTRSEKLATVGKLAAGLAHEINNPLGVIQCYAELLRSAELSPQQDEDLGVILRHTRQAQSVLSDLLNFARPKAAADRATDLGAAVNLVANVFAVQAASKGTTIVTHIPEGLPRVFVEPQAVEHVASNLIINALDAVPGKGGRIEVGLHLDAARGRVVLTVDDNGPGVPETVLPDIFTPFVTTKDACMGTGLGLAVVYGVMNDLGGSIDATPGPLGGARFSARFPVPESAPETDSRTETETA